MDKDSGDGAVGANILFVGVCAESTDVMVRIVDGEAGGLLVPVDMEWFVVVDVVSCA